VLSLILHVEGTIKGTSNMEQEMLSFSEHPFSPKVFINVTVYHISYNSLINVIVYTPGRQLWF